MFGLLAISAFLSDVTSIAFSGSLRNKKRVIYRCIIFQHHLERLSEVYILWLYSQLMTPLSLSNSPKMVRALLFVYIFQ